MYKQYSEYHFCRYAAGFYIGYVLPILVQMAVQPDPEAEDYRTGNEASVIYEMLALAVIVRLCILRSEIYSCRASILAVAYFAVYVALRAIEPYPSVVSSDRLPSGRFKTIQELMPLLHVIMLIVMACESVFYLRLNEDRAKYIKLFCRASADASMFLFIFVLIIIVGIFAFHVLGAEYGDTDTFGNEYEGEYPLIAGFAGTVISMMRNSVGDLRMPQYTYWTERYGELSAMEPDDHFWGDSESWFGYFINRQLATGSQLVMIGLIWLAYFAFLFIQVILALNILIAIVSQSYESVMDRQQAAIIQNRMYLNQQCLQEWNLDADENIEIVVLQTAKKADAGSEWDGFSQAIKKDLKRIKADILDDADVRSRVVRVEIERQGNELRAELGRQ